MTTTVKASTAAKVRERYLTEAEAWREIGEAFGMHSPGDGMCEEIAWLLYREQISSDMTDAMRERLERHMQAMAQPRFMYAFNDEGDWHDVRCLAALFLALECDDEAKAARSAAA